jgi:hypothetical protein
MVGQLKDVHIIHTVTVEHEAKQYENMKANCEYSKS